MTTMIAPDDALRLVLEHTPRLSSHKVPLPQACGLELAEPVLADRDFPPFPRSMMDGYAVRLADAAATVEVIGEVAAGCSVKTPVTDGRCLEIMTGAPCPPGTEAVVQKEHVRRDGNQVTLPREIKAGGHIAPKGSECRAGVVVLKPGDTITPLATAVIASVGLDSVLVTRRPSLAVITTGSELVPPGTEPAFGQIRDSNGPMLASMARDLRIESPLHLHVTDREDEILQALSTVAEYDIVLLTGGVSVGNYDLVPSTLQDFGAEAIFHKVRQKPGKPLLLAKKGSQLLFGLPGNPLACHFCFHYYVATAIRKMSGKSTLSSPVLGSLTESVEPKKGRTHFVAACAQQDGSFGPWAVRPLPGVSSADIFGGCMANCYAEIPPGHDSLDEGNVVSFTWIGNGPWPN
jgi:molybdopterin molybdotransferase